MVTALNIKLRRDLWRMKGQASAIAAVIAVGVLLMVMMSGLIVSLDETRRAYYERYRLADIYAPTVRAPALVSAELAALPGVTSVLGRITGEALLDIEAQALPLRARILSLPKRGEPKLNDVLVIDGTLPDPDHSDEILLLDGFANAHGLAVGDRIDVTLNGLRRAFRIAGLARSPEFLYSAAPGEIVSDDSRFAVIWMNHAAAAAAFDMEGAFNEALLSLGREANAEQVIDAADRVLKPYGSHGAYGIEDLLSNRFITEEIAGLRATSTTVPPVFLLVAAFLLYIVISRMVQAEREEIGLMKAFGYRDVEIGWHYMKFVLAIAAGGSVAGCLLGVLAGRAMIDMYLNFFKFPFLVFRLDPAVFIIGIMASIATASAGSLFVLRRIFALTPATAMRPPAPADFSRSARFSGWLSRLLDSPSRMILRRLARHPLRMAGAVAGVAFAMALSAAMTTIISSYDQMLDLSFAVIDRSDLSVTFTYPRSQQAIFDLKRMPGVAEAEPVRIVPAILRNGLHTHRGSVSGLVPDARLYRAVDRQERQISLPEEGIVLSEGLADILKIGVGEPLTIEVREGRRPVVQVEVASIAESLVGSPAFMQIDALNRALDDAGTVSGAYLRIDGASADEIYASLKRMPSMAGVSRKEDARASLRKLMDQGAGAMRYVMLAIAVVITFGVVYNTARIAQAERARDLASLRVIGFTRGETAYILLGELAVITLLALPIGSLLGYLLSFAVAEGFSTDLYRIAVELSASSHGAAGLAVLAASVLSGWLVKRDIDRADLVAVLKTRE
jgi:putative ABC transport system permease protein